MTYVEPVDVLVPVGFCDRCVGDVRLLRVVLGVAVRLRHARHWRWLLDILGFYGLCTCHRLVERCYERCRDCGDAVYSMGSG
jgi:hypothetical protein